MLAVVRSRVVSVCSFESVCVVVMCVVVINVIPNALSTETTKIGVDICKCDIPGCKATNVVTGARSRTKKTRARQIQLEIPTMKISS